MFYDIRAGMRILWKSPGISVTAVILIAMVIGGNTAIYSMMHSLLTRPAPGVEGERLVTLGDSIERWEGFNSYPDYSEYAAQSKTLDPVIGRGPARFTLTLDDGTYALTGGYVTPNFFDGLGVRLSKGRSFNEEDNRLETAGLVAIISHRVWQERFQASEDIVARSIAINGHSATIIGVGPPRFAGPTLGYPEDVWVPAASYFRIHGRERELTNRADASLGVVIFGRLKPGVSISQAQAEFTTLSGRLQAEYPETNRNKAVLVHPYVGSIFAGIWVESTAFLAVFSVVTAITLLIVCANVANLLLGRAVIRQRETAVRQSLGASRLRILRMLIAEGLTLAISAWIAACIFAYWFSRAVPRILDSNMANPNGFRPNHLSLDYTPDWQVLAYAMVLALIGTTFFTMAPALRSWRQEVLPALRSGEPGVARGRTRLANVLVVIQLAFSVLLLTTAGLAYRSLSFVSNVDLGFDQSDLLLVTVNPSLGIANREVSLSLLEELKGRLQEMPGITAVTYSRLPPPYMWSGREPVRVSNADEPLFAAMNFVGPDYLATLGLKTIAGREFSGEDRARTTGRALINRNLAEALWPGQSAVGQILLMGRQPQQLEVIGVVPNALYAGFSNNPRPYYIFLAEQQNPSRSSGLADFRGSGETTFFLRYTGALDVIVPSIRAAMRQVDVRIPIVSTRTLETQLDRSEARIASGLLTLFSAVSLLIAIIGQYAVIAFDMRCRTRELGVRVAMGASSRQIVTAVLREGLLLTGMGLMFGFALSVAAGMAMRSGLYGVTPTDATTYVGVFSLLAVASLLACYLPARRAARVDPLAALRSE